MAASCSRHFEQRAPRVRRPHDRRSRRRHLHRVHPRAHPAPRPPPRASSLAAGRPRLNALRATEAVRISATAAEAETTSAPAAEEDGVREFFDTQMVDEAGMLAASSFPIPPADLIAKCKLILAKNNGGEDPSLLASDFEFVAPVVGPLEKERFLAAFQSFKIDEGFPRHQVQLLPLPRRPVRAVARLVRRQVRRHQHRSPHWQRPPGDE